MFPKKIPAILLFFVMLSSKRDAAPVRALFLSPFECLSATLTALKMSPARVELNDNDVKLSAQVYADG